MRRISLIICSHDPRPDYLRRVLESLQRQTLPREEWELLLIDNASSPRLDCWDLSWHPQHAYIREDKLGLTPARLRGIKESSGELLLFVDDDNLLAPDYLERAAAIERNYPRLSVFGAGVVEPEFEVEPAPELIPCLRLLALRTSPSGLWTNNPRDSRCMPWGAGLYVTRQTAAAYVQLIERLKINDALDRRGKELYCGGDDLFSWASACMGCGFGVFPELRLTHLIRAERLNQTYFLRLLRDHAYSHSLLSYLLCGEEQHELSSAQMVRILLHGIRRGRFSMKCQWAAARGAGSAARYLAEQGLRPIAAGSMNAIVTGLMLIQNASHWCRPTFEEFL